MKRWLKLYTVEWIEGSIRIDLTPAQRSVWADLLAMAALSRREGYIERSEGIPYTAQDLAARFVVDVTLVNSTIESCLKEGRITMDGNGTYQITNWGKYQAVPDKVKRDKESKNQIPLSPEDREASQQAAAARLGYLHPDAAQRGIKHREVEEQTKKHNKDLKHED